jgi:hypothetical protein
MLQDVSSAQLAITVLIQQLCLLLVSLEHLQPLGLLSALLALVDSTAPTMLHSSCCNVLLEHMPMKLGRSSVSHVLRGMSVQQPLSSPVCVAVAHTAVEECQLALLVRTDYLQITQEQLNVRVAQLAMHA